MEEKAPLSLQFIRCRFLNLFPSSIISMSYNPERECVAVGRENGSIQLYDSRSMMCYYEISGYKKDSLPICKLHWYGSQLLMTSFSGYAVDWDLKEGCARRNLLVDGGGVWDSHLAGHSLLLACQDGAVRAISLAEEFYISYTSVPQQSRALAICGRNLSDRLIIYSGHSDGTLARWDCGKSRTATNLMKGGASPITALAVISKYEKREFVVAGNSKGNISIWDCKNSVRLISFDTHKAAILSIKQDRGRIFASGSDSLIVCIAESEPLRWKVQNSERAQSHDVLALQMIDEYTLLSGGITTDLCVHSLNSSGYFHQSYGTHDKNKHFRHIVGMSQAITVKHVQTPENGAFICVNKSSSLEIFRLDQNYCEEFLGSFKFKGGQNISCFALQALSENEVLIAVSELTSLRIIIFDRNQSSAQVIYQEKVPHLIRAMHFGQDYLNVLDCAQNLSLYQVSTTLSVNKYTSLITRKIEQKSLLEQADSTLLLQAQFSPNTESLCLLYEENKLTLITLNKQKSFNIALPHVKDSLAYCLQFLSQNVVIVTYSNNQIIVVDLKRESLLNWSINYSFSLPKALLTWYNKIKGCCSLTDKQAILFSHNGYFAVDFTQAPPKMTKFVRHQLAFKDRQESKDEQEQWFGALERLEKSGASREQQKVLRLRNFEINTQNFGILGMGRLRGEEVLVYECDFSKMVKTFPKALKLKKYGY